MRLLRATAAALALLAGAAHTAAAQTIAGTVTDTARVPLADVVVEVLTAQGAVESITTSNASGAFTIVVRRPGSYRLRFRHLGYTDVLAALDGLRPDDRVDIHVVMGTGAVPLEPLIVRGTSGSFGVAGFHERMARPGTRGEFITRVDIDRRRGARATELLRNVGAVVLVPVRPEGCAFCTEQHLVMLRGSPQECLPTVYVDGIATRQDPNAPLDTYLTAEMLEGVEVYRGVDAPPPLIAHTQCGVVAFWTRQEPTGGISWRRIATFGGIAVGMLGLSFLLVR